VSGPAKTSEPAEISAQLETTSFGRRQRTGLQGLIATAIEVVGLVLFVAVMLATLLQVFARYAHIPIPWTEEFARTAFLASVMLGIALATYLREHIVVDFLFVRLSQRGQARLWIFFNVGILLLLIVWLRGAWRLFEINTDATFVTLPWLSVSWLYGIEAFSILLMIFFVLADLVEQTGRVWDRP
jgi:TRAP-type C4-dicarboxylate transport system permease small subunit